MERLASKLGWVLVVPAMFIILEALWVPVKAQVAQVLLNVAWETTLSTHTPKRPWPWADHYPVARLQAPEHNIDQIVLEGDSGAVLAFAPGENIEARNTYEGARIISGHRDTHFRFLKDIELGDHFVLHDLKGVQAYRVVEASIVDSKTTGLYPEAYPSSLMLVTCYPFDAISAGGDLRYVVLAQPVLNGS